MKKYLRRAAAFLVTAITFYIVFPELLRVLSAWPHLSSLAPAWLVAALGFEVGSFVCSLALQRMVLRTRTWFPVVTASLTGNAVTNVLPAGDAIGAGVQFRMLVSAGIDSVQAGGGLAVFSLINVAALFGLPLFTLPAVLGGLVVNPGLQVAAILGIGGFVLIAGTGLVLLKSDRALSLLAMGIRWLTNLVRRRRESSDDLGRRLIEQRNLVATDLGRQWYQASLLIAGRIGLDYLSLLAALRATGARPNPSLILLAYAATTVVSLLPFTPGGLGLVEATLSGLLVLAGVGSGSAVLATLAYRLGCYWLPIIAGGICYALFRRRYRLTPPTPAQRP